MLKCFLIFVLGFCSSTSDLDSIANSPVALAITHSSSFIYIPVDEVEEVWRVHVDNVVRDLSGRWAVHSFHVFTQLYKVMQQRFCNLTREACNYLGDKLRDIALQFHILCNLKMRNIGDDFWCGFIK